MGSKSNTWEAGLLDLLIYNTDFTGVGDAGGLRGSAGIGSLYISLHTADPSSGDLTTNEANYTNYQRYEASRSFGWNDDGTNWYREMAAEFVRCTGGSSAITHWGLGTSSAGAGKLLYSGTLSPSPGNVSAGIMPTIGPTELNLTEE